MWPNTFWIQMYSLQISKNTTLDTLALYNYWLVKPHWHLITIKVWMKTLIIAPSCAHFWSWKKLHISAGMLYLECNCNHNSASCFCDHSPLFPVLIHLLLKRTEYCQLQIVSKKLTKMHTHLCIDIRVVLLFVNRTGKLVEMSADEK